jgi:septal ring factor EnvC (AmiA/AmiB activator)
MPKKRLWLLIFWVLCFFLKAGSLFALTPAEEKQLFQLLGEIKGELKQINKRIDDLNKRIDDTNKRIDETNKRIDEVKEELNKRIDDTNKHITEVKEELNKRIDDTNKRIDKLIDIMIGITAVFGGLVVAMMGLVFWDRKTLIEKAVDKAVQQVERRSRLLLVLREFAKTDERLAAVMRSFGLL